MYLLLLAFVWCDWGVGVCDGYCVRGWFVTGWLAWFVGIMHLLTWIGLWSLCLPILFVNIVLCLVIIAFGLVGIGLPFGFDVGLCDALLGWCKCWGLCLFFICLLIVYYDGVAWRWLTCVYNYEFFRLIDCFVVFGCDLLLICDFSIFGELYCLWMFFLYLLVFVFRICCFPCVWGFAFRCFMICTTLAWVLLFVCVWLVVFVKF